MKEINIVIKILIFILFAGCAVPQLWVVSSNKNGGVIGYSGYHGEESYYQLQKDLKKVVRCPDVFVLQDWERKSQTTQNSMIIPVTNNSTTNTSSTYEINNYYGQNLMNVNGNSTSRTTETSYEVVPYTSTESWVEQKYVCDWAKANREKYSKLSVDEKINYHQKQCDQGEMSDCDSLAGLAFKEKNDLITTKLMAEKICLSNDSTYGPSSCYFLSLESTKNNQMKEKLAYLKRGCSIIKSSDKKPRSDGYLSCAYHGALIKDDVDLNIGLPYLISSCSKDKKTCYNLSCIYSLIGEKNKSLEYLKISLDAGYNDWEHINTDSDLNNIKKLKLFKELIHQYQLRTPANKALTE